MSVAPSYQTWARASEPYEKNNKMYILVINPKTNTEKEVRFYPEKDEIKIGIGHG